jgi:hypothetical protein
MGCWGLMAGAFLALYSSALGRAETILKIEGPARNGPAFFDDRNHDDAQATGMVWQSESCFQNVRIQAALGGGEGGGEARAYLVTRVGPDTKPSDLLATTAFRIPLTSERPVRTTLFENLRLAPGTYHLVLSHVSGAWGFWWHTFEPRVEVDASTRYLHQTSAVAKVASFPPASNFSTFTQTLPLVEISGTKVDCKATTLVTSSTISR